MPLIRRLTVRADEVDAVELDAVRADMVLFAEREALEASNGFNLVIRDARGANALQDILLARLRRAKLTATTQITAHDCPHVAGFEEATFGPCTLPQYNYTETNV